MKFMKAIKLSIVSISTLAVVGASSGAALAIPYQQDANVGTTYPAFNVFTGTPSEGDESDFLRGKEETNSAASTNVVNSACTNGAIYRLRVYIHNGAQPALNNNGTGAGVAHGAKVRVQLPTGEATSFSPNAVISANNATSIADNMTINCGGKKVTLSYVAGSAAQFSGRTGTTPLSDSIVTSGASVGTYSPNGDIWGCWDERVWVTLNVRVEEPTVIDVCPNIPGDQATVPSGMTKDPNGNCVNVVVSTGECRAVQVTIEDARTRRVGVNIDAVVDNGASIIGYRIDWGDGTSSDKQKDTHTYAKETIYRVSASVQVRYNDGRTEWKTANGCIRDINFEGNQPPQVTPIGSTNVSAPTSLPVTGPAGIAGIFAGVSTVATLAYSVVTRRFGKTA